VLVKRLTKQSRQNIDKRDNHQKKHQKRLEAEGEGKTRPVYLPDAFTKDEIASEDRRPKRKVAVMLGYSGSGYKGMQIMPDQRTIEGDLFQAFVAAGAISKANADDPKKSGLVRCARTDKGVHAAGNVISLKLIIEDKDIVQNINSHLSPQIRVWGIQRTTGSFSCYAACDSRWYEYLIPTHSFLPPHPSSYLATQIAKIAEEDGQLNAVSERQSEVADFWEKTEAEYIRPILESLDAETRELVEKALHHSQSMSAGLEDEEDDAMSVEDAADLPAAKNDVASGEIQQSHNADVVGQTAPEDEKASVIAQGDGKDASIALEETSEVEAAIKSLRAAYITAKRTYRIAPARLERVREALSKYVGTHNFHNFTVRKSANDPSSKRHIKSFEVASEPILIEGTEWLSLKVHGQSFMMHQIRKMVAMVALVVRCGCPPERITESMSLGVFSIPKAPGLGLLLERPVFDSYNERAESFGREDIDFGRYKKEMEEFKKREIYDRIFQMEEKDHV
jgi:tRNA pseudouridine38-40 synthase